MNKKLTLAILSISAITVMASAAVSPALANISNAFPEAGTSTIKTILTLPSLFIIPFSMLSGLLTRRWGNKTVLILGILIYLIGGVAPVLVDTIPQLLVFRAILGAGCGLIMPISLNLIAQNYSGSLRTKLTGYSGAVSYLMGIVASFVVAPVSSIDWHYSFYIYLVAILVLILNIAFLPNDKPAAKQEEKKEKKSVPPIVWWIIAGLFFVNVAFYAVPANVALFMKEQQIGEAQSAGTVISVFMIAGFIAGVILSKIQTYFKKNTLVFGVAVMALGYTLLSLSKHLFLVIPGAGLVGFSFGILYPSFIILITGKCSSDRTIQVLGYASAAQFLGQFLSPYLLQAIKAIFHMTSLRYDFIILAAGLSAACVSYYGIKTLIRYRFSH